MADMSADRVAYVLTAKGYAAAETCGKKLNDASNSTLVTVLLYTLLSFSIVYLVSKKSGGRKEPVFKAEVFDRYWQATFKYAAACGWLRKASRADLLLRLLIGGSTI